MRNRNSRNPSTRSIQIFFLLTAALLCFAFCAGGCGAPGEPTAPSPPIPTAISDLDARQAGEGVRLLFSMPVKTVRGDRLAESPSVEIFRGIPKADGSVDTKALRSVYVIPGALVGKYRVKDGIEFVDPIAAEDARAHDGAPLVYIVRTRLSKKRASADSNAALVRVFAVAEKIAVLQAKVTESAVVLTWTAPTRTSTGDPLATISEYRMYRGELDPASQELAAKDLDQANWKSPLVLLGPSSTPEYRDTAFEFGKVYLYSVRSVAEVDGQALESSGSSPAVVTPRDTFPPQVPSGVVAAVVGEANSAAMELDLSWAINAEADLAGYRVYRSEQENEQGQLCTAELLLSPAYRDTSVLTSHRYWYRVTAVDRSGNESVPSAPVAADVVQPYP
jgi:hypothetical protein